MLQDLILTATAAAAGGSSNNAEALQQMGFSHMIQNFDIVGWVVFITLIIMSVGSWWYTVVNAINNARVSGLERVFEAADLIEGRLAVLRSGKKSFFLLKVQ